MNRNMRGIACLLRYSADVSRLWWVSTNYRLASIFMRGARAHAHAQVKIQQDSGSPTLWGDACCVMLSGTLDNVVRAQQMILERIANTSDRLKELVSHLVLPQESGSKHTPRTGFQSSIAPQQGKC